MNIHGSKILVVGAGSIGMRHIRTVRALGYRDITVCDPDEKKRTLAKSLDIRSFYTRERDAFTHEKPAIVFVCNPTHLHVPSALRAIAAGADLFIEKPLSHRGAGTDTLIGFALKKKRIAMVACNWRFSRAWQALYRAVKSGRYGSPLSARIAVGYYLPGARKNTDYKNTYAARKNQGGGVILDTGSHVVDYLQPIMGEIKKSAATVSRMKSIGIESEESAVMIFTHANGAVSEVSMDFISHAPVHRIEIITDRGMLTADLQGSTVAFSDERREKTIFRGSPGDIDRMFTDEIRHFFDCVQKRKKPLQDLAEAQQALEILLSAKRKIC